MRNIIAIIGSASGNSSSHKLIGFIESLTKGAFNIKIFDKLKSLPHFDPALSTENTPDEITAFRKLIENADGIIFSTPEYIFSIPSGLKNALEWFVSTTLFSGKPIGIITASAHGEKGHAELQLIMKTLMASFTPETTLLIQGVKGKVNEGEINEGNTISDERTRNEIIRFVESYKELLDQAG